MSGQIRDGVKGQRIETLINKNPISIERKSIFLLIRFIFETTENSEDWGLDPALSN